MKTSTPDELPVGLRERIRLEGELTLVQARALLKLRFSTEDRQRMRQLSAKARGGTLTFQEEAEINTYEQLGCLLDVFHSKARRALARKSAS